MIVESYLTPVHRDDPGHGCAVPTLGAEIARESPKTRRAFAAKLEQMIDMLADQIPDVPRRAARKQAMAVLATMIGTLVLSRIAGSGRILRRDVGRRTRGGAPWRRRCKTGGEEIPSAAQLNSRARVAAGTRLRHWSNVWEWRPSPAIFAKPPRAEKPFPKCPKDCKMPPKTGIRPVVEEHMRSIGHFIGGKEVKGTSGRTADVFRADDRRCAGQGGAGLESGSARGRGERARRAGRMGRHQPPAPRPRDDEIPRTRTTRLRQARRSSGARTWQDRSRRQGRHPART